MNQIRHLLFFNLFSNIRAASLSLEFGMSEYYFHLFSLFNACGLLLSLYRHYFCPDKAYIYLGKNGKRGSGKEGKASNYFLYLSCKYKLNFFALFIFHVLIWNWFYRVTSAAKSCPTKDVGRGCSGHMMREMAYNLVFFYLLKS